MRRNRKSLAAVTVASALAASTFCLKSAMAATTIGDWENMNNEGWFDWTVSNGGGDNGGNPGGTPSVDLPSSIYTYSTTTGVTLGKESLRMSPPTGYNQNLSDKLEYQTDSQGNGDVATFINNSEFAIDVTYNSAEWSSNTTYANTKLIINSPAGFTDLGQPTTDTGNSGYPGGWDPTNYPGVTTRTLTWDYSSIKAALGTTIPGYAELVLYSISNGTGGYYFDNARLTSPALTATWSNLAGANADGTFHWGTIANWTGGMPSNPGDVATFGTAIPGPETVSLNGNEEFQVSVGKMIFSTGASYTTAQGTGGTISLNNLTNNAEIDDTFGNHTISAPLMLVSNTTAAVGQATNTLTLSGNIGGAGGFSLNGTTAALSTGTVLLSGVNSYKGGTTVASGTLVAGVSGALPSGQSLAVTGTGIVQLAAGSGVQTLSSLSVASTGTFDINNNHIFVTDGAGVPAALIADLAEGHASNWAGPGGIISTYASTHAGYGVGFGEGSFFASIPSGEVELSYTLYGDVNQDGSVNGTDFGILASNFGKNVSGGWEQGDFNYDGKVNATDFGLLASNFGKTAAGRSIALPAADWAALDSFAAAHGLLADVPEPATAASLAIAGFGFLARRRRQTR